MPVTTIAVAESLTHPSLERLLAADVVAVTDPKASSRWSSATVVRPPAPTAAAPDVDARARVMRLNGVAVIVCAEPTDKGVTMLLSGVPDPLVVLVVDQEPTDEMRERVQARGGVVLHPVRGALYRVRAVNEVGHRSLEVDALIEPAPLTPDKPKRRSKIDALVSGSSGEPADVPVTE